MSRMPGLRAGMTPPHRTGIQNPGVDRMSDMSSMLHILVYREAPSHHEPK